MKKKILLVLPRNEEVNFINVSGIIRMITRRSGGPIVLSLATVAALTIPGFEVKIIDEDVEEVNFSEPFDIVGIGGFSCYLNRAERIALEFSKRGSQIVCGGSPATFSPERWREFADVLILGEAEKTWPRFLQDYLNGTVKKEYIEEEKLDISLSPVPDFSGFSRSTLKKYLYGIVQISRGCPYVCEFCSVHQYVGNQMRYKHPDQIIEEVEQLYHISPSRIILIAGDNFGGNRSRAKEILRALKEWNSQKKRPVTFIAQLSIDAATDPEFLELAAETGLTRMSVGVETPNAESLKETRKFQNLKKDSQESIKRFNEYGILVHAGSIVGFDNDDKTIFRMQLDFFNDLGIPNIQTIPLQAPDGSPLKERMIREERYLDWEAVSRANPGKINSLNTHTIIPKQMTVEELHRGTCWLLKNLYLPEHFLRRMKLFFENYEQSPVKDRLHIPKSKIDWYSLGLVVRLLFYVLARAERKERRLFWDMAGLSLRSSHPHKMMFLVNFYLSFLNTWNIVKQSFPEIDTVDSPY